MPAINSLTSSGTDHQSIVDAGASAGSLATPVTDEFSGRQLLVGDGEVRQALQAEKNAPKLEEVFISDSPSVGLDSEDEITDSDSFSISDSGGGTDLLSEIDYSSDQEEVGGGNDFGSVIKGRGADFVRGMMMGATFASVYGANLKPAQVRAFLSSAERNASDRALEQGHRLQGQINELMNKLDLQLREMGGGELARAPEAGRLQDTTLTSWDHMERHAHRLKGFLAATVETVGWATAAVALPTVTGILTAPLGWTPTGIATNFVATGAGAYTGITALRDFPSLITNRAALSLLDSEMAKIQPLLNQLNELIAQEKARQDNATRTMLISLERDQVMAELKREVAHVDRAIDDVKLGVEVKPLGVFLAEGTMRGEIMAWAGRVKSAFQSFFAPIASAWFSLTGFVAKLPSLFSDQRPRSEAQRSEFDYATAYKPALDVLGTPGVFSDIKQGADIRFMMAAGYSQEEMDWSLTTVRRQLHTGENLMRLISESDDDSFGAVVVSTEGEPSTRYALPSSVSLSRALAAYFSVQAEDEDCSFVALNEDGSLSVEDRGGRLFNFLMSTPSAYTSTMTNSQDPAARTRLTIDDHGDGFPWGAKSMQFEHVLKLDEDGQPVLDANSQPISELRLHFLWEQPKPVYAPLANEGRVLKSMYVAMQFAAEKERLGMAAAPGVESATDFSGWSLEELRGHRDLLQQRLKQEELLQQIDQDRFRALQNWGHPLAQSAT